MSSPQPAPSPAAFIIELVVRLAGSEAGRRGPIVAITGRPRRAGATRLARAVSLAPTATKVTLPPSA
jgi:hypothetical protein